MPTILAFDIPPTGTDFVNVPAIFGNDFTANAAGTITGIWYYHELSNEPASVTATVHRQSNQQLLASKTRATGSFTDDAYNLIMLDTPLDYPTPNEVMTISVYWPLGGFSFSAGVGVRTSNGLSINVGNIGRFRTIGAVQDGYPTSMQANTAYPVGVEFTFGSVTPPPSSPSIFFNDSWQALIAIEHERQDIQRQKRATPPIACPRDGQALLRKGSILHCPFDGWQWPRDRGTEIT